MTDTMSSLPEDWKSATPEQLFDACCLSQQVVTEKLREVAGLYRAMQRIHAEAAGRGMKYPDLITAADKAALGFVSQNPLQN